jgi:hypothetical protein
MEATKHVLPSALELFPGASAREVGVLSLECGANVGFERASEGRRETRVHPLFGSR